MATLLEQLDQASPGWRENISRDPLEAAVELGLIEPEDLDTECQELNFHD